MIQHRFIRLAAVAAVALGIAAPAAAEYYVKFLGRDPGNQANGAAMNRIAQNQSGRMGGGRAADPSAGNGGWVELSGASGAGFQGGLTVAAGDVNGDGAAPLVKAGPGTLVLSGTVSNCRVGDKYSRAELRDGRRGAVTRLEGVTITSCADGVTISYTGVGG